jgi:hypothetical protein
MRCPAWRAPPRRARRGGVDVIAGTEFTFSENGTHFLKGVPAEWAIFRADG